MEEKHTPAPWHLSIPKRQERWAGFNTNKGNCYGIYATNDDLEAIAIVPKDYLLVWKDQNNIANAQLISTAPELLRELQSALYFIEALEDAVGIHEFSGKTKIKETINKALGL